VGKPWHQQRRPEGFQPAITNRPSGPRRGDSKVEHIKQGVHGALRAKNVRLLLSQAAAPEDVAQVAQVSLERLQAIADGAFCSDETAYHIEQQLKLTSGWLDRSNHGVPSDAMELIKNPVLAGDDEPTEPVRMSAPARLAPAPAAHSPQAVLPLEHAPERHEGPAVNGRAGSHLPPLQAGIAQTPSPLTLTSLRNEDAMQANELRRQNLAVLLEGKGAKSALARVIGLSPASVTSMVNGSKPLDKAYYQSLAQALKLPDNWFEKERTRADVPDVVLAKLAPLPHGARPPAPSMPKAPAAATKPAVAPPAATAAAAAAAKPAPAPAPAAPVLPKSWPSGGSKVARVRGLSGQASDAKSNAVHPVPASLSEAPVASAAGVSALRAGDALPAAGQGFVIEGEMSPITEALIKTLAQKARQGVLSEDRAFELLGAVRAL
jgi:hypothetical protein